MAKRKKYPKLPNGFGSIRKLPGNRRNPYCVQPSYEGLDINGCPIRPKPLCYVDNWYKGFAVLTAYNAGTYTKGMELSIDINIDIKGIADASSMPELIRSMLSNYALMAQRITGQPTDKLKTFADVYAEFYEDKFSSGKEYSASAFRSTAAGYKNSSALHNRKFCELRYKDLQDVVDTCELGHATKELIVTLFHQMYKYAVKTELVDTNYSEYVEIKTPDDDEHGVPFSQDELKILWNDKDDPTAEMLLIMCYSGHRISEYKVIDVDLRTRCMDGGIKTKTSRERTVPIHPAILPLIKSRIKRDGKIMALSVQTMRNRIKKYCTAHGMEHTPHDTRHTFAALCDKYHVPENDKKRMLGHSFADVTNKVYGHRELEDLRVEIERIEVPF